MIIKEKPCTKQIQRVRSVRFNQIHYNSSENPSVFRVV